MAIFRIQHINDIHDFWICLIHQPYLFQSIPDCPSRWNFPSWITNKNPLRFFDWCGELIDFWVDPWLIFDCKFEGKYIVHPPWWVSFWARFLTGAMLVFGRVKMEQFHGYFSLEVQPPSFIGWFTNHLFLIVKVYHHPKRSTIQNAGWLLESSVSFPNELRLW